VKYTLLKSVQLILSAMGSDEVNSIGDTTEANMVVDVLERTYNDIASTIDFPDHWDFFDLTATSSATPTIMTCPTNVGKIEWIQYDWSEDTARDMKVVKPLERVTFFNRMNTLDSAESDIYQFDYNNGEMTFDVRGYNDRCPTYYTTMDDNTLIFDNYDVDIETQLSSARTLCYGMLIPEFDREDAFIPEFDHRQFTLYFNEAMAACFHDIKQVPNSKAEQRARRGWNMAGRKKPKLPPGRIYDDYTYDFGRKGPH
jgi:hypothetical protein